MTNMNKALVVLSGGQDSITCLAWAAAHFDEVHAVTFDYGQRHRVEIKCAEEATRSIAGVSSWCLLDVKALNQVATSALTNTYDDVKKSHVFREDLPASFVPNRNAMFTTLAHSYAQTLGIGNLVLGVCQTDFSGYPDCRQVFIDAISLALNLGSANDRMRILTPLMYLNKAQTWEMADDLGVLQIVIRGSHTCYEGDHETFNEWGYGCGTCPACQLRSKGFHEFMAMK